MLCALFQKRWKKERSANWQGRGVSAHLEIYVSPRSELVFLKCHRAKSQRIVQKSVFDGGCFNSFAVQGSEQMKSASSFIG